MKKILFLQKQTLEFFVEGGMPSGGSAVEAFVWMQSLNSLGFEVYQTQHQNDTRPLKKSLNWIKIIRIYDEHKGNRFVWYRYRFPFLYKVFKENNLDYVYTIIPSWYSFHIGMICRTLKIKHIVRISSDNVMTIAAKNDWINKSYFFLGLFVADFLLPQNNYQEKYLRDRFPKNKILKIFNPIIIDPKYLKVKQIMGGYIAWVANFRDVKNMTLLFKIAKILPEFHFKIAGSRLSYSDEETENSIEDLKKLKNVEFVGNIRRNDIFSFFSGARFLLNTSKYEGFSNTFLEAMATGTPIITSLNVNPDGIIDLLELGIVYKDEYDLKEILSNFSEHKYVEFSENCVAYLVKHHDNIVLGKKLIEFLT